MKFKYFIFTAIILFSSTALIFAQRPPRPPRGEGNRPPRPPQGEKPLFGENNRPPQTDFFTQLDGDKNGKIGSEEYRSAADAFFRKNDKNGNGIFEENEFSGKPEGFRPPTKDVPPFLFLERGVVNLTRSEFDEKIQQRFAETDANGDGVINRQELEKIRPPRGERPGEMRPPPPPPTAEFLGAEMRFGDKLIKNAPFSAEILIENSRRLFDGSVVTKQSKGTTYRDGAGRTRRERTLDDIAGFSIGEPQKFVVINDFPANTNYFIDLNRKTVRQNPLRDNRPPQRDFEPKDGKTESLGTKMLEGVSVEGTRTTFEIPVGQIGNDKPIQVVTEKWYSPELQLVIMSKHTDPLAGEQIFRLVNIKLGEPSPDLFTVPNDFKMEKNGFRIEK
jgi:hypothetical protein